MQEKKKKKNGRIETLAWFEKEIFTEHMLNRFLFTAKLGQRAFVGKVNMDTQSPEFYVETTQESVRETEW